MFSKYPTISIPQGLSLVVFEQTLLGWNDNDSPEQMWRFLQFFQYSPEPFFYLRRPYPMGRIYAVRVRY